jgi:hypothetical protein
MFRSGPGATTPRQVVPKKPMNIQCAQPPKRNALLLQPLTKVFDHFDVEANRCAGEAPRQQVLYEGNQSNAKIVSRYSLTGKSAFEDLLDHGETRNMLCFQGSATFPPAGNCRQMQTKISPREISPLHNYHLCIFASLAKQTNVRRRLEAHINHTQRHNFLNSCPGIEHRREERVITTTISSAPVNCGKQRLDLVKFEVLDRT